MPLLPPPLVGAYRTLMAPLRKIAPTPEFNWGMTAYVLSGLHRNFTLSGIGVRAGFMLWPRAMEKLGAHHRWLADLGMHAFNVAVVWGNPYGVAFGLGACLAADRLSYLVPVPWRNTLRTVGFIAGMAAGKRS